MSISGAFPDTFGNVCFHVVYEGIDYLCRIRQADMQDFVRGPADWSDRKSFEAFPAHRVEIEQAAVRLIRRRIIEPDGSVLLTFEGLMADI